MVDLYTPSTGVGPQYPDSPTGFAYLSAEIRTLRAQIAELQGGAPLRSAGIGATSDGLTVSGGLTITDGGDVVITDGGLLRVQDGAGVDVLRVGALTSAPGWGLEVRDPSSGQWVPLSSLTGGMSATSSPVAVYPPALTSPNASTGWVVLGGGPVVTVTTYTGRILVIGAAELSVSGAQSWHAMSWDLAGPQTVAAADAHSLGLNDNGESMGSIAACAGAHMHQLTPGTYTITARHQMTTGPSGLSTAGGEARYRTLIAIPY